MLLFIDRSEMMLYIMAVIFWFGTCIGTVSGSVLTSKLFGAEHYAETYGFVSVFVNAGFAVGSPMIAATYDMTGSYHTAWIIVAEYEPDWRRFFQSGFCVLRMTDGDFWQHHVDSVSKSH